jgi:glyoxylase-like metal-dependent hydrolase (beta-lactamase superfamily II)
MEKHISGYDFKIQSINDNIYRIPIPVPFPMKFVYCYVFKENDGWVVIDTGFNDMNGQEAWKHAFAELNISPKRIHAIYLTHFHPDHMGLAHWMQELSGAPVFMSEEDLQMSHIIWSSGSNQINLIKEMFNQNGVPAELVEQIGVDMKDLNEQVNPLPNMTSLNQKHVLWGDEDWEVIKTPGHSDGHLCFYQAESKILIAGDQILDKITPNISIWPGGRGNPLQDYILSLQNLSMLDVEQVLPGHGVIIKDLPHRIKETIIHHEKRIQQMNDLAKDGATVYEVAHAVFGHRQLGSHQWRFAIAETLAHLEFLLAEGKLVKTLTAKLYVYEAAAQS